METGEAGPSGAEAGRQAPHTNTPSAAEAGRQAPHTNTPSGAEAGRRAELGSRAGRLAGSLFHHTRAGCLMAPNFSVTVACQGDVSRAGARPPL